MLSLGPIGLFAPWALLGLVSLPVVWWLVRFLPPSPKHVMFPAARFLMNAERDQQQHRSSMWWVLAMRILAFTLLILAAADPVVRPQGALDSSGPVVIVIDDGWSAAPGWQAKRDLALGLVSRAEREDRPVMILTTAPRPEGRVEQLSLSSVSEARRRVAALQPKPWAADPVTAIEPLFGAESPIDKAGRIFWLSDGVDDGHTEIVERLMRLGPVTMFRPDGPDVPVMVHVEGGAGATMSVAVDRGRADTPFSYSIVAYDDGGVAIGRTQASFGAGESAVEVPLDLPLELRNRVVRVAVDGPVSAGGVALLDDRWRRKTVGLVGAGGTGGDQPLLSGEHYVGKALGVAHQVRDDGLDTLIDSDVPVIAFDDPGTLEPGEIRDLNTWVESGGVLVVFAGPRFADAAFSRATPDAAGWADLLPVTLRQGNRAIGGAMSWRQPATIARFGAASPFAGLEVPGDVRIRRQILAEPDLEIEQHTWAKLSDGTPLVTGAPKGQGWTVLFHVTANAEWSNLPFSGLFVEMLERVTALAQKTDAASEDIILPPEQVLDGFGALQAPGPGVSSISSGLLGSTAASPRHPPGFYGDERFRRVLNVSDGVDGLRPLTGLPGGIEQRGYVADAEQPVAPWLLAIAFLLLFADLLVSLWLRGHFGWRKVAVQSTAAALMVATLAGLPMQARAAEGDTLTKAIEAAARPRFAYIETGDRKTDQVTQIGLAGLGRVLHQRTAVELAEPVAVNPAFDDLAFYPLIYWPVIATSAVPSTSAAQHINTYLNNGGMILFDTKSTESEVAETVGRIADVLDVPKLTTVPENHVLTRSFYLLDEFPGRWNGRPVWIAPAANRVNDGVAPIIAGSHDWAAAWAMDEFQEPLFAVVPGGERQRELAFRFGVNVTMYALTGNYKGDQVHIPSIMQRLGQ